MGILQSTANVAMDVDDVAKCLLAVLPHLGQLSLRMAGHVDKTDKRNMHLNNFHSSTRIIERSLRRVEARGKAKELANQIESLARCLEKIINPARKMVDASLVPGVGRHLSYPTRIVSLS
jgi:hypothetical protein